MLMNSPKITHIGRVQSSPIRPARLAIVAANLPGSTGFET